MQSLPKHIVIVAGEESGDRHAAELVSQLRRDNDALIFSGIGGRHLQAEGVELISDLARFGVTGLVEVIRHARTIKTAFSAIKAHLRKIKPDLLILVDYPGFNLRLARFAKQELGLHIIYYISPQIWAWKAKRIHAIKANIDHMAVILPFEKAIYEKANVPASFVGHPLVNKIPQYPDLPALRKELGLPKDKKIIALLPGSRRNEINYHMPVLVETICRLNQLHHKLHFVIPVAGTLDTSSIKRFFNQIPANITFLEGQSLAATACSDCVVVASGTASLECALQIKPMCIVYKASLLTYYAATKLIKVKYLGLCNLLANRMIAPELLQYDFNTVELVKMIERLLFDKETIDIMQDELLILKSSLSLTRADTTLSELVKRELGRDILLNQG